MLGATRFGSGQAATKGLRQSTPCTLPDACGPRGFMSSVRPSKTSLRAGPPVHTAPVTEAEVLRWALPDGVVRRRLAVYDPGPVGPFEGCTKTTMRLCGAASRPCPIRTASPGDGHYNILLPTPLHASPAPPPRPASDLPAAPCRTWQVTRRVCVGLLLPCGLRATEAGGHGAAWRHRPRRSSRRLLTVLTTKAPNIPTGTPTAQPTMATGTVAAIAVPPAAIPMADPILAPTIAPAPPPVTAPMALFFIGS